MSKVVNEENCGTKSESIQTRTNIMQRHQWKVLDHLVIAGLEMKKGDGQGMDHYDDNGFDCIMGIGRAI